MPFPVKRLPIAPRPMSPIELTAFVR